MLKTLDSVMKKSTSPANLRLLVLSLVASCLISSVSSGLFTHYRLQRGKRVGDRHLAALQLNEVYTFSARFRDPQIDCGVACNLNPACLFSHFKTSTFEKFFLIFSHSDYDESENLFFITLRFQFA